jgi:hypothetical protein
MRLGTLAFFLLIIAQHGITRADDTAARFPEAPRIVAIGDLHGDLEATRRALRLAGAIDRDDHWSGGSLVLVQTGDLLDRGDDEQAIMDLLSGLAEEAAAAGGAVHLLLGNHELMNASFDFRYVTRAGFADFEDAVALDEADTLLAAYEDGKRARAAAFRPGGPYAEMMARWNVVVMIGDNLFIHGGVLPHHVDYGLERLNSEVRAWLLGEAPRPDWIDGKGSPVWTRRYSSQVGGDDCEALAEVLNRLSVRRMVVGHTVQDDGIRALCGGEVWCIDVGSSAHYGGELEILEIVGDTIRILREE